VEWSETAVTAVAAFRGKHAEAYVELESGPDGAMVDIGGWLGLEESVDLQALLCCIVNSLEQGYRLSLDLSTVTYISSTGVGALSNALVCARKKGAVLAIARISESAERILKALGILGYFQSERYDE
jgi:anti-anti-sigma factor